MRKLMPLALSVLTLAAIVGCDQLKVDGPQRQVLTPPGIAPIGEDAQTLAAPVSNPDPSTDTAAPPQNAEPAPPVATGDSSGGGTGIINKTTAEVVDAKIARQNPNIIEVSNEATGQDPVSFALSAYVSVRSKASTLAFQKALNDAKLLEGMAPSFADFQKLMKQHRIEFTELYPYQMYGYDPDSGNIVILEDMEKKAAMRKAAGLDPNDG